MPVDVCPSPVAWRRVWPACAVAVLLRVLLIAATPADAVGHGDTFVYHNVAVRLAESAEAWLQPGSEFGYRAPLYFAYLAAVHWMTGAPGYHVSQLANVLLVLGILVLLYRVTAPVFGATVATLAVWLRAVLPTFVMTDVLVMSEPLFDVFLLGSLAILLPRWRAGYRPGAAVGLGLLLGAAVLTRQSGQGLGLIALVAVAAGARGAKEAATNVGLVGLGMMLLCAPWLWRNTVVWGSALPLALTAGPNLHMGNSPDATGTYAVIRDPAHAAPADIAWGTRAYDRWHKARAVEYIGEAPGRFVAMSVRKWAYLVWPRPLRTTLLSAGVFPALPRSVSLTLVAASGLGMAAVWMFGVVGLAVRPMDRYGWATVVVTGYAFLTVAVAFGSPRFADPIHLLLLAPAVHAAREFRVAGRTLRHASLQTATAWSALGGLGILWTWLLADKLL